MPNARVSVIIPNYNHAAFLKTRIDSVLNQSFRDFDLLIMDDRSTDSSVEVINGYKDVPGVSIALNEQNSGNTFLQWKKGLALTQSDYVWIAESDDAADPSFLAQMVAALDAHPSAGMAYCDSLVIDGEGKVAGSYLERNIRGVPQYQCYDLDALPRKQLHGGHDYLRQFMVPFNTIPNASAILFRRSAIEGKIDELEQMRLCGDWLVYCRILLENDICYVPAALNSFRTHGANVRIRTKSVDFLRQQRLVRDYVQSRIGPAENSHAKERALAFESWTLLQPRRDPRTGAVPLGAIPSVIADAVQFGPALLLAVVKLLAREQARSWLRPSRGAPSLN